MRKLFFLIQAVVLLATISICGIFLTLIPVQDADSQQQQRQQLPIHETINEIFKKVENSTVGIITESNDGPNLDFDGTGFVYDVGEEIPYVVTNSHVVEGIDKVDVSFIDGSIYTAEVIGRDRQSDIAVLQIIGNVTSQQQQQPPTSVEIGDSSELQVGEQVIAIGYPFLSDQSFANLLTTGVISKLGVEYLQDDEFGTGSILNAIVTDTAIAEGNSGGPLLNLKGEVIGMNTAADDDTSCCTYAIPSNTIKHIVPILIETGEYIHPWIGFTPLTLNADPKARQSIPSDIQGVIVSSINKGGPVHKANLSGSIINQFGEREGGDIITAVDGESITTADEFNAYIDEHKSVDEKVELSIYRNGQHLNKPVRVTLVENPDFPSNDE
jgi:S1-C subfamily serine protease